MHGGENVSYIFNPDLLCTSLKYAGKDQRIKQYVLTKWRKDCASTPGPYSGVLNVPRQAYSLSLCRVYIYGRMAVSSPPD